MKAQLFEKGGEVVSALMKVVLSRPSKRPLEKAEEAQAPLTTSTKQSIQKPETTARIPPEPRPGISLPTSEETAVELKRRLARELYKAELDLAAGLKIAGKSCDCLSNKHTLMLEAAAEELISQDPDNTVYRDIIDWIAQNRLKVSIEAIQSGQYTAEYPYMANEFKNFRKRVMGSVGTTESPPATITLEQAKKMAAEEAAKEVERAWKLEV